MLRPGSLRSIIVDDEAAARRALVLLMERHPELTLVGQAGSVRDAATLIAQKRPDVAFLDIEMAGRSGFSLLSEVRDPPRIVIVTAHALHAARAFDVEAVDFLLKPVPPNRFAATVRRLLRQRGATTGEGAATGLHIATRRGSRVVDPNLVAAVLAERDYARLVLPAETPLLADRSLGALEGELPNPPFLRVSRSVILNLTRVTRIEKISRDRTLAFLRDIGEPVELGREAGAMLRRAIAGQ